jgi:hypothetical protein
MSRGPGRLQRLILEAVEQCPDGYGVHLMDLAPPENIRTPSDVAALRRAASKLIDAGKVGFYYDHAIVPAYLKQRGGHAYLGPKTTRYVKRLVITRPHTAWSVTLDPETGLLNPLVKR